MAHGNKSVRSACALVTLTSIYSLTPHLAIAQGGDALPEIDQLEEITVTAQLRREDLQVVPISVQVVDNQLPEQNVNNLTDLSQLIPSLKVQPVGRSNDMYLRGTGSGNNPSFNQSLGTFVDGIYHGRSRTSAATFLDIERIELLKGPQSTFFGNNAIAGAVSIISRAPQDEFSTTARAFYGEFGQYALESAVGGSVTDGFNARVAVIGNGQEGYLTNVNDRSKQPNEDNQAARLSLLFEPNSAWSITAKFEGSRNEQEGGLVQQLVNCPPQSPPFVTAGFCATALGLGVPTGTDNNLTGFDPGQNSSLDTLEGAITVDYRISENLTVTSITGYYDYDYELNVAADSTPLALLTASVPETFDQFSQELRITSNYGGAFEFLGGVYFQDQDLEFTQISNYFFLNPTINTAPPFAALIPFAPISQQINFTLPEKTYSVFGSVDLRATDALVFSVGLRGTEVEKSINQTLTYGTATQTYGGFAPIPANLQSVAAGLGLGVPGAQSGSRKDHALMPSAQIKYAFTPEINTYVSYSNGFKAGGFNGVDTSGVAANLPYNEEKVDAVEIGAKTRWNDGTFLVNLDMFRSKYTNLQVVANSFNAGGAIISLVKNAATSISQGVELETQWLVTPKLRFTLVGTYLDAYYDSYPNAGPTQAQQRAGIRIQDLSGRPTSLAPEWNGSLSGAYTLSLGESSKLTTEVIGIYSSDYFLSGSGTDDPLLSQDSYTRVDARVSLALGSQWVFDVIGKNLTDEVILVSGSPQPTSLGSVIVHKEMPRNFGAQVRYRF